LNHRGKNNGYYRKTYQFDDDIPGTASSMQLPGLSLRIRIQDKRIVPKKPLITPEITIPEVLKERIKLHPDQLAQIDGDKRMTYKQFGNLVYKLASGLCSLGIKPGEKVALILPEGNTFPVGMYAVIQMGGVSVGINPTLKAEEYKYLLNDSEAVAVILTDSITRADPLNLIREIKDELPSLRHVIVDGKAQGSEINLDELIERSPVEDQYHQADSNDLVALVYTSGTTGQPKASMHSHYTILYSQMQGTILDSLQKQVVNIVRRYGLHFALKVLVALRRPIISYSSLPPYTGGGAMNVIGSFLGGSVQVHMEYFSPTKLLALIEKEKITGITIPPALGMMLIRSPNLEKYDLRSLMYVFLVAAPVPPVLIDEFRKKLGIPVANGFGSTEMFSGPTTINPITDPEVTLRESIGKVRNGYEVKIVDTDHNPVPTGEVGELAVRSGVRMLGYYKAEELNRQTFDEDGWYLTGDQATMDEDGYIRIVGRIKDMIIRAGQNIYPAELENILVKHPKIHQASVIGVPDPISGEKVLAYIIPNNGSSLTTVEVLNYCRENMAPYKVPADARFVDEFPLNATGKVLKRVLREKAITEIWGETADEKAFKDRG
jgi:fatty-acyl-CoA synthase